MLTAQVTKGSVDEGIHALAMRKLRLDAAVLDGITATGDSRKGKGGDSATDTVQVRLVCKKNTRRLRSCKIHLKQDLKDIPTGHQ